MGVKLKKPRKGRARGNALKKIENALCRWDREIREWQEKAKIR